MADDPEKVFEDLTAAMGAPPLSAEEKAAVLRLAKAVADASGGDSRRSPVMRPDGVAVVVAQ